MIYELLLFIVLEIYKILVVVFANTAGRVEYSVTATIDLFSQKCDMSCPEVLAPLKSL